MVEDIKISRDIMEFRTENENLKKKISDYGVEAERFNSMIKKLTTQLNQRQEDINKFTQNTKEIGRAHV